MTKGSVGKFQVFFNTHLVTIEWAIIVRAVTESVFRWASFFFGLINIFSAVNVKKLYLWITFLIVVKKIKNGSSEMPPSLFFVSESS